MILAADAQLRLDANWVDYTLIATYFVFVLGIGILAKRAVSSSIDFFLSGRSAFIDGQFLTVSSAEGQLPADAEKPLDGLSGGEQLVGHLSVRDDHASDPLCFAHK